MKKLALVIVLIFTLSSLNLAEAASTKPTPKPSATKKTEKKTTTLKKKPTPSAKASETSTKKATTVKKTKKKRKPRPKISITPSPPPTWPPAANDFSHEGEVYAKVQSAEVMAPDLTDWRYEYLRPIIKECSTLACGNVYVVSENGCTWWEAEASVYEYASETDKTLKKIGTTRSIAAGTKPQQFTYIIFRTALPLTNGHAVQWDSVSCHHDERPAKVPDWSYTAR
jgi:hypothetical protein